MKILITGSRGYVGYNLIQYLQRHAPDIELIGLDSTFKELSKKSKDKLRHDHVLDIPHIDDSILEADLPLDVTHVIHLAGRTGVRQSWNAEELKSYYVDNVLSTQRIFNVYTRPPYKTDIPILYSTSSSVKEMKSPYAMTQAMKEAIAPTTAIGMRFFTIWGGEYPRTDMLYGKARAGSLEELTDNKRDFTHIRYVCESIYALLLSTNPEKFFGRKLNIYDIGTGHPRTPKEFLEDEDILSPTQLNNLPIVKKTDESQITKADPTEIEKIRKAFL